MKHVIRIALLGYIALLVVMTLTQRGNMYHPGGGDPSPAASKVPEMVEIETKTSDGLLIESWLSLPKDPDAPILIFFHGNAGNLAGRDYKVRPYLDAGLGVVLAGYRGYEGNSGNPSEEGLYKDARSLLKDLTENRGISKSRIVLYGESLGSGVAVQMASEYPGVRGLVLEVPYDSMLEVARAHYPYVLGMNWLLWDQYRSDLKIGQLKMPKLILVAAADEVVPARLGQHLYDLAAEPKKLDVTPGAGHNQLYDHGAAEKILTFIRNLPEGEG